MSAWFFFTRKNDSKEPWQVFSAEDRAKILETDRPTYVTVLDCNHSFKEGTDEPQGGLKYRGPLYFDWDAKDGIVAVMDSVREFMEMLESLTFDVSQARWYLSGSRGVHCEIPQECFMDPRIIAAGVENLHLAYKRFAFEHITPYLDMRVYTGKRGRQWRTTCNNRGTEENPRYKVAITADQLREITDEEMYKELCKTPCHSVEVTPPTLNRQLKVEVQVALDDNKLRVRKNSKANRQLFRDWDSVPPTFIEAFSGVAIQMDRDLNDIKMQIALAAIAAGVREPAEFLKHCDGFIEMRLQIGGTRHNTKRAIQQELENTFNYFMDNPAYVYTPEQFDSILQPEYRGNLDVRGVPEAESARVNMNEHASTGDMAADFFGVIRQNDKNVAAISDYTWKEGSVVLIKNDEGRIVEISAIPVINGESQARISIDAAVFHKPAKLLEHIGGYAGFAHVSNSNECQKLMRAILLSASKNSNESVMHPCNTEGYYVAPSGAYNDDGSPIYSQFWIEPERVTFHKDNLAVLPDGGSPRKYIYLNPANRLGVFGSKMLEVIVPDANTPNFRETIHALMEVNGDTYTLGVLLGWFTACLVRQPLLKHKILQNFPVLQNVGDAGTGKTTQLRAIMKMYPHENDDVMSASNSSMFGIQAFVSGSSTMPTIVDEYKPLNLPPARVAALRALILEAYTPDSLKAKGGGTSSDSHYSTLNMQRGSGPLSLISEQLDTSQAAIVERSVVARFTKATIYQRRVHIETLQQNERQLSMLGRLLLENLLNRDLSRQIKEYTVCKDKSTERFGMMGNDRIVLNAAVILYGLKFLGDVLRETFKGDELIDRRLEAMEESLMNPNNWILSAQSEVAKVLEELANYSHGRGLTHPDHKLLYGTHYKVETVDGEDLILLDLHTAFTIYRKQMISLHLSPSFDTFGGMLHGIQYSVYCKDVDVDADLGTVVVLRADTMARDNLSPFRRP